MAEEREAEEKILQAAHEVFQERGFYGARMQDIADRAGINKALLHYYYRSKDRLFELVFRQVARRMFGRISGTLNGDLPLEQKVNVLVATYLDFLVENPFMPGFLLNEMGRHHERLRQFFNSLGTFDLSTLTQQLEEEAAAGRIRPIATEQFVVNLVSLCVFPFVGRPMLSVVFGMDDARFRAFIEARKREIPIFFLNGLRP